MNPSRRHFLAATSLLALGGCASDWTRFGAPTVARPISALPFARPVVRMEDILAVRVGLRPFRQSGFVVRGERMGDKIVIHNYGHGGAGITLSWGSSTLAARELPDIADKRVAVIGGGVMGLTTARLAQQRGWKVTLYAREFSPHTTSDIAGGYWAPTGVSWRSMEKPSFNAQLDEALALSHASFTAQVGDTYGVSRRENYHLRADSAASAPAYLERWPQFFPLAKILEADAHPFPEARVLRHESLMIEPPIFLARLMEEVVALGGSMVQREFAAREEILALDEPVIFNCTGLGARILFGDEELTPIRGQVVLMKPDPAIDFLTHGGGEQTLYMFPRQDALLMGGTFERGLSHTTPDDATTLRIVNEHRRLFAAMRV